MTDSRARSQSPGVGATAAQAGPSTVERARAFRALYEAQLAYVWRSIRRLGAREAEVEDLAHEVFVRAYQHLHEYDPARPVKPWLFGIAFRVVSEHRRLARNVRESLEGDDVPETMDESPTVLDRLASKEAQALVTAALEALSMEHRAVFVMTEMEGASAPEIAEALGIPLNTAYSRLRKARQVFTAEVRRLHALRGEP